jgi:cysteine-rich repeat protein
MLRGYPRLNGSRSLFLAAAAVITLGCGDDGRTTAGNSATTTMTGTTVDLTTGTSDGTGSASEASVTQGSMSEGMTTSTTTSPTTTSPTTTVGPTTSTTDDTTGSTGAVSAGTSTGVPGPVCGNGVVEEAEECDDGDDLDKNACSNACTKVPCDQQEGGMDDLENVLSYIWISNSSQNTVSKINTKTAIEEGRYQIVGGSPSRTSVNLEGDVAVSSRDPGGVTKIAAKKENCVDKNADGVIQTSTGPNDVLPLGQDECVIWTKTIPSPGYGFGPRATAWDGGVQDQETCKYTAPKLWIGWMDAQYMAHFERLDGATGNTLDKVDYQWQQGSYSPYGGAVDAAGNFYATGLNTAPTIKIDAQTLQLTDLGNPAGCKYGMTLDGNGDIWAGACFGEGVYHWDHNTNIWTTLPNSGGTRVNGIMADADGNVWGAGSSSCRLVHIDVQTKTYVNNSIPLPGCSNPWGVSIDFEGYVWVVDMSASVAFKVDPMTYQTVATVQGLVGPYTYSDMTGVALKQQVIPQ